jgi:integrase
MPISGERRLIKASGRIGLWFSSLLVAGLLFSVLFSLIFSGAGFGGAGSIFLIFRVTMTFALPVGCLYLPVLIALRNTEEQRMPIILLGGILIGPASMALCGLVLEWRGGEPGCPLRQITLSAFEYPTEAKALARLQEDLLRINGPEAFRSQNKPTLGLVIDRFMKDERIEDIVKQKPGETTITDGLSYSTARGYRSYLTKHVKPRWGSTPLSAVKALEVTEWLKSLPLSPKTRGQVRALLHLLFEKAMLWGLIELQRNPIELVKVKGSSKRQKRPQTLAPGKFHELVGTLKDPYKTMVIVAMCTGLRVSEVLALRWEHIDFKAGAMLVQQGVVNGRIGKVKTEASHDEVPLDPAFAEVLLRWKGDRSEGLVFPSHVTGGCYYSGVIQVQILKPKGEGVGITGLGWHTLRHTYRSLLDETGAPIGVQQKLMRHANVSTTMNVYGNASLRAKQEANSKVVQMVIKQEAA